jgi:hypothetical protein
MYGYFTEYLDVKYLGSSCLMDISNKVVPLLLLLKASKDHLHSAQPFHIYFLKLRFLQNLCFKDAATGQGYSHERQPSIKYKCIYQMMFKPGNGG